MKIKTKSGLRVFTYNDIKSWTPCYDPLRYIPKDWRGTAIDILNMSSIPFEDRLWCALRLDLCSEKLMRLFAVWSYRQTLKFVTHPDPRSIRAVEVSEAYANGLATKEELSQVVSAAYLAAYSASLVRTITPSVRTAAYSAESAASAVWTVSETAAESARNSIKLAGLAIWNTKGSTAESIEAAKSIGIAIELEQQNKLIEMLLIEGKQRLQKKVK